LEIDGPRVLFLRHYCVCCHCMNFSSNAWDSSGVILAAPADGRVRYSGTASSVETASSVASLLLTLEPGPRTRIAITETPIAAAKPLATPTRVLGRRGSRMDLAAASSRVSSKRDRGAAGPKCSDLGVRSKVRFAPYRARGVVQGIVGVGMVVRADATHLRYSSQCRTIAPEYFWYSGCPWAGKSSPKYC
jgi:hypothetical protein